MIQGARVLSQLEFAQPKQGPSRSRIGTNRHELPQHFARFGVSLLFVEQRAEIPQGLFRLRLFGKNAPKQPDGIVHTVIVARLFGGLQQLVNSVPGSLGRFPARQHRGRVHTCREESDQQRLANQWAFSRTSPSFSLGEAMSPSFFFNARKAAASAFASRSEEHTSELQSLRHLVCRLLL